MGVMQVNIPYITWMLWDGFYPPLYKDHFFQQVEVYPSFVEKKKPNQTVGDMNLAVPPKKIPSLKLTVHQLNIGLSNPKGKDRLPTESIFS